MVAVTEKEQASLGYGDKVLMEVGVYFYQEIQSSIYHDQTDRLQ